jgi:hypothetical protein
MALYEEISLDTLKNILAQDEEEKKRKALENYNTQKTQLDSKYENNGGGLGGFLGSIIGGIGKGIGDVGTGVYDLIGSGVASAKDLIEGKAGTGENLQAFKKDLYKTDSMKDAYAKSAGTALNAATTLATTAVPGLGAGGAAAKALGGVAANTAAGAIGGFADELQQQGENASLESAANRAISGAAGGLIGGKIGSKVGNASSKLGGALLNNKLATSAIGRGAIAGAAGGAAGAGTSAALGGGDVANAALQGAISGAGSGAAQGAVMAGANKALQGAKNKLGIETEVKTPRQLQETETKPTTEDFMAYGESELANKTKGNQVADFIRRTGESFEGAQTNVTRQGAKKIGLDSTGKVVEKIRKRTGITDSDVQAQLAKELTGGENSLLDNIQRNALSANEDGSGKFLVDTENLLGDAEKIIRKNGSALGQKKVEQEISDMRYALSSKDSTLLDKANVYEAMAAEARNKGYGANAAPGDSAKAKMYKEIATKLEDMSYNAIPQENVEAMFGAATSEMRARANQARNNGNEPIAKAYDSLATEMENTTPTVKNFRNFKKDFVDISKINKLTLQAENGAAQNLGQSAAGIKKKIENIALGNLANKGLAKAGGALNAAADYIDSRTPSSNGGGTPNPTRTQTQPMSQAALNLLGNFVARTEANRQANDKVQSARKNQDYQNLEDQLSNNVAAIDAEYAPQLQALQAQQLSQSQSQLNQIATAMDLALAAGDVESYNKLASLYQNAYKINELQNPTAESKISTAEKNQLAKLESAGNALDQLESLYNKAGGGQGIIGGNIANFLGSLGVNADVDTYNQLSQGLINQIGAAIGKTDSLNTEGEVQRALQLVPKITDSAETAKNKLASLRALLKQNTNTYSDLYGA